METLARRVATRFLQSDERYQIPAQYKHLLQMIEEGELDPKVLLIWKKVVEKMGPKFDYGGAIGYWRNKVKATLGFELPAGPEVKARYGAFQVKTGDQIEEWVKEYLKSKGMLSDAQKTVAEWEIDIDSLERSLEKAKKNVAKHEKSIAEGKKDKRLPQWLATAQKNLETAEKDLKKARQAVQELGKTIEKHETVVAPVIDFEKQFQLLLHQASNDLAKREVLAQAKRALEKFEAEMVNPKVASERQGFDLWDMIVRTWNKLWGAVKAAFATIRDWTSDLTSDTKQLDKLLSSVS